LFSPLLDNADFELLRKVKIANQLSDEALELITDLPRLAGSNAWVVAPHRSASGTALLAADPHLEINRLPAIWYEAVLHWGDHYVMGATLPGCPLFAVARTERLSWGVTYLKADTSDYFIEDCRPGGATGWQYRRDEQWHDFEVREEIIQRKGGANETFRVYHNSVGTLDCDPEASGPGYLLSLAWVGAHEGAGRAISTWLDVVGSESTLEGMRVARDCPQPTLCWLFADREGHIGLQAAGWVPKRRRENSGLLPVPAWDERNHWRGRIDENSLPSVFDPPEGFVANANEDINPPLGPPIISLPLPNYRKRRIVEVLNELPKATLDDMKALQYDVTSLQARDLLAVFLPHLPDSELKRRLAGWDCRYSAQSREATLFLGLYRNVLLEIFGYAGDGQTRNIGWRRMLYLCSRVGYSTMVLTSIDRLLHQEHSLWWEGRNFGELIRRAAERLEKDIAKEPEQAWGRTNALRFTNRFFESPRMGRALGFHTGDMPLAGCHATPFQGHLLTTAKRETSFAPSYHFVTDIGTDEAWSNLPGGPSESRFSPYYKNDLPRWLSGEYKRLAIEPAD
jgi:penicillin amidase